MPVRVRAASLCGSSWQEKKILELERIKGKAEETCNRLQGDIQNIKQQKVQAGGPAV